MCRLPDGKAQQLKPRVGHDDSSQWLEARRLYCRYRGHNHTVQLDMISYSGTVLTNHALE